MRISGIFVNRYYCDLVMEMKLIHRFKDHGAAVYGLSAGRDGHKFFSASGDKFVTEWNAETQSQEPFAVKLEHPAYAVFYVKKFDVLLVANSLGGLHVINLMNNTEERYILHHTNGIFDLQIDENTDVLYVAGGDGVLSIWQLPTFELLRSIKLCDDKIRQIALGSSSHSDFRSDSLLALACGDGNLRILENNFYNEIYTIRAHEEGVTALAWHPSKPVLISGGKDAHLRIWNCENDFSEILAIPAHNFAIYRIVFSPDGLLIVTASRDKTIKIWDANTLEPIQKVDIKSGGHSHSVNDLLWLDNDTLVSCSDDRSILIFERL